MRKLPINLALTLMAVAFTVMPALGQQSTLTVPNTPPSTTTDQDIAALRQNIRAQRKQLVAANMNLTADEATKFWPIYDQYEAELVKIRDGQWALMKAYVASYPNVSPDMARRYMEQSTAIDQQMIALREKYVPIFGKVIPPNKAALWYQIDRRIDLLVNLQYDSLIPFIDPTKQ